MILGIVPNIIWKNNIVVTFANDLYEVEGKIWCWPFPRCFSCGKK